MRACMHAFMHAVEVRLRYDARVSSHAVVAALDAFLGRDGADADLSCESELPGWREDPALAGAVELISVGECCALLASCWCTALSARY